MAPEIFDRATRRAIAGRSQRSLAQDRWLIARLADEALARLRMVDRDIHSVLTMGTASADVSDAISEAMPDVSVVRQASHGGGGVQFDEDRPPFADGSFDAVLAIAALDTVSDLPGALVRARQMLRPGGVIIASTAAAGSLPALRAAMGDLINAPRFHPQIDVRAAGDLLVRAGFVNPVADVETMSARYRVLDDLIRDLRANGLSNALPGRKPFTRTERDALVSRFADLAVDGRITEDFHFVHMVGRARAAPARPL